MMPGCPGAVLVSAWLLAMAFTTLIVDPIKYPLIDAVRQGGIGPVGLARVALNALSPAMVTTFLLTALLGLGVIVAEWRTAAISRALTNPAGWLAFLAALVWFSQAFLAPGHLLMGDLGNHIALVALRLHAWMTGASPYWNNFQTLGQPVPEFYGPTTFWPMTILARVAGSPTLGTKLFLFAVHVGSGLTAFALARAYGIGRAAAFITGLVYAGSFAHLHLVLYRGVVPSALPLALLPLAFLFLHRMLLPDGHTHTAAAGLIVTASLLLMNYVPLGVVAGLFMALYAGILLVTGVADWRRLMPLALAGAAALGLAAWVLLPAILASTGNAAISGDRVLRFGLPSGEMLNHLVVWRAWRTNFGHDSSAYLGLVALGLATVGFWSLVRQSAGRPLGLAFAVIFLLSLVVRGDFLRSIIFTLLPLAILAGFGAETVFTRFTAHRSAPALLFGLLLLDNGPTALQPLARTDLGAIDAAGLMLAVKPGRTLEGTIENGIFVATGGGGAGILQLYPATFVAGGYIQLAGPAQNIAEQAANQVTADLQTLRHLSPATTTLLCDIGVARIVAINRTRLGFPDSLLADNASVHDDGPLGRVIEPACAVPSADVPAITDQRVTSDIVRATAVSAAPGSIRLPWGWYAQQNVTVNGQPVLSTSDSLGLHSVPVPAGTSDIAISPGETKGRALGRSISLTTAAILLAVPLFWRWRVR